MGFATPVPLTCPANVLKESNMSTGRFKEAACEAVDAYWDAWYTTFTRFSPGLGRSPGEGKDYPLQYSGLENSMDSL